MAEATRFYPLEATTKLFLNLPYVTGVSQITTVNIIIINMISDLIFSSPRQHFLGKNTHDLELEIGGHWNNVQPIGYHMKHTNETKI